MIINEDLYKITIKKVDNGFLVTWKEDSDYSESDKFIREHVFQIGGDSEQGERECLSRCLSFLVEYFNCDIKKRSPGDEEFIKISMVKAADYFDNDIYLDQYETEKDND